ncbi:MAG: AMP-binding protein, partial [Actinomycetes bacterium]
MPDLSFDPLTPTAYLDRAAEAHGDRVAVVDGGQRWTYRELHDRCGRLAGGLAELAGGRPVAVLAPNSHVMLESHFAVPWAGVPLVALNTRLSPAELAYIVGHSEAGLLVVDDALAEVGHQVASLVDARSAGAPPLRLVRVGGPQ